MSKEIRSPRHEALRRQLKLERQKAELTQAQLAARLGWDQTTISDIETGAKRVTAIELIEALGFDAPAIKPSGSRRGGVSSKRAGDGFRLLLDDGQEHPRRALLLR
jgi:transcriptional regulator with XRE-family HTH domain